jgi:hypothetical protein
MTTESNNDDKDYSVLRYYLNKPTLGDLKKIINHFKQLVKNESKTLSIEEKEKSFYGSRYMLSDASFALIKDNNYYKKQSNSKQRRVRIKNLNNGLKAIAMTNKNGDGDNNSIDIYEWLLFNNYMEINDDKDKEKFLNNSQKKINGLKEDRPYNEINIKNKQYAFPRKPRYEEYLNILRNFKSNIEAKSNQKEDKQKKTEEKNKLKRVNFVNDLKPVLPKLSKIETNKNLASSARSMLTSRTELAATQRDISVTMSKIRGELMNEWKKLYEKFKKMYKDSYIILNQQRISTEDFEKYLKNPICESQNISQKKFNKFINLQGQTEQKEVLYKVNKIILLCRYVNELYCIIEKFKDKLQDEQKYNVDSNINKLKKIIENLLKINTKDNTDIDNIDSICEEIKDILDNFKEVIKGIKSDLDVPFIKDNFEVIEIPRTQRPTISRESKTTKTKTNSENFKAILKQIDVNNAERLSKKLRKLGNEEEFNLSKIFVKSNGQDIEKSKQYLEIMIDFYSLYDNNYRQKINPNVEHQAFIEKLKKKLIDILNKDVIFNIKLLKYNFLDAEKVYAEIINEIEGKKTNRKK